MRVAANILSRILFFILFVAAPALYAAEDASGYVAETDPLVQKKLSQWSDWKFGFLMHWGPYSQWGVVESWSLCAEDVPWCQRPAGISYVVSAPWRSDLDAWLRGMELLADLVGLEPRAG